MSSSCDNCEVKPVTGPDWRKIGTGYSGIATMLGFLLSYTSLFPQVQMPLFLSAIAVGGIFVVRGALRGLTRQRFLNIDFLVVIATIGALYLGEFGEAAAIVFFFSLAEAFEEYGIARSRKALEALVEKSPKFATLSDGSEMAVENITVGTVIAVKPGKLIPLDGEVVKGQSAVNEASITGEPLPKEKTEGDTVYAGTLNENGYLEIRVTKESKNSTIAKIVGLVEEAQKSKTGAEEFIDRFAKYYTPGIAFLALAVFAVPVLFLGGQAALWLERAITLLVIACPCALVIATPVTVTAALGGASRRGVLIRGGRFLEMLGKIRAISFDKTGTLTQGEPRVAAVIAFNGFTEQQVLEDAAGIETYSSHPLSKAILAYATERGVTPHTMEKYENVKGKGGQAVCLVCDDTEHLIGNLKMLDTHNIDTSSIVEKTKEYEEQGMTIVLVTEGHTPMGALAITDTIRSESSAVIERLRAMKVTPVMLTGDHQQGADYVAVQVGITEARGDLLPEDKVREMQSLKAKYDSVAMVGDGVNDAPSLAIADVGIAMGARGSDVAIETADIALMNDSLSTVPDMVRLGRRTLSTVKVNVFLAIASKLAFIILTIFGISSLGIAIAADTGIAILVTLNGLRLFRV
ncbi:MAG: cation-translocating P-type ATPase [Patescibacteria group bacterium]